MWVTARQTGRLRPYCGECTRTRPISEVKPHQACSVLGWETPWERQVLQAFSRVRAVVIYLVSLYYIV